VTRGSSCSTIMPRFIQGFKQESAKNCM
jgi:hypothetical protein